jgi:hypothetical protein
MWGFQSCEHQDYGRGLEDRYQHFTGLETSNFRPAGLFEMFAHMVVVHPQF